jgi:hypothetical protein
VNVFLFFITVPSQAQVSDTIKTEQDEEIIDTVIVKKGQVVITQTYYLEDTIKRTGFKTGLNVFLNSGSYSNYYSTCTNCASYTDKIKKATHPLFSYGAGIDLWFMRKWLIFNVGFNYNTYRERFNYTDSSNVNYHNLNSFSYIGVNAGAGVQLVKTKKINLYILSEGGITRLIKSTGKTIAPTTKEEVINNSSSNFYSKYNYIVLGGIRVSYSINSVLKCWIQPYFQGDLWSVTNSSHPYLQQKGFIGMRLGLFFQL